MGLLLIADDDPAFISELTKILLDWGCLVLGAKDGQAAADLLNKHQLLGADAGIKSHRQTLHLMQSNGSMRSSSK